MYHLAATLVCNMHKALFCSCLSFPGCNSCCSSSGILISAMLVQIPLLPISTQQPVQDLCPGQAQCPSLSQQHKHSQGARLIGHALSLFYLIIAVLTQSRRCASQVDLCEKYAREFKLEHDDAEGAAGASVDAKCSCNASGAAKGTAHLLCCYL